MFFQNEPLQRLVREQSIALKIPLAQLKQNTSPPNPILPPPSDSEMVMEIPSSKRDMARGAEDDGEEEEEEEYDRVFYEDIEAPKFVDLTAPDAARPSDDPSWFCLRIGTATHTHTHIAARFS